MRKFLFLAVFITSLCSAQNVKKVNNFESDFEVFFNAAKDYSIAVNSSPNDTSSTQAILIAAYNQLNTYNVSDEVQSRPYWYQLAMCVINCGLEYYACIRTWPGPPSTATRGCEPEFTACLTNCASKPTPASEPKLTPTAEQQALIDYEATLKELIQAQNAQDDVQIAVKNQELASRAAELDNYSNMSSVVSAWPIVLFPGPCVSACAYQYYTCVKDNPLYPPRAACDIQIRQCYEECGSTINKK